MSWELRLRGGFKKKEHARLTVTSSYVNCYLKPDKSSGKVGKLNHGDSALYSEVILSKGFCWIKVSLEQFSKPVYIPIRCWNGLRPDHRGYCVGAICNVSLKPITEGKQLKKESKGKPLNHTEGMDIYIDNKKNIMYVSVNERITDEGIAKIKEGLEHITDYKVIVMEKINSITYIGGK